MTKRKNNLPPETRHCRLSRAKFFIGDGRPRPKRSSDSIYMDRERLAEAQDGLCGICGHELPEVLHRATIDHVIPYSRGGADEMGNFLAVHRECNIAKSSDIPTGCEMVFLLMVNAKINALPVIY